MFHGLLRSDPKAQLKFTFVSVSIDWRKRGGWSLNGGRSSTAKFDGVDLLMLQMLGALLAR